MGGRLRHALPFAAGLAAVCLLAGAAIGADPPPPDESIESWGERELETGEWTLVDYVDIGAAFVRRTSPAERGEHARIWQRSEYREPQTINQTTFLSTVSLIDVDCEGRRTSTRQVTYYPRNNMGGPGKTFGPYATYDWQRRTPRTIGDTVVTYACEAAPASGPPIAPPGLH